MADKEKKIDELLLRNVQDVIARDHLRAALLSGKKLRVKFGIDPTSPDLHLGHAVALNKLREFQELGHTAILLIGNFTAQIGDPSGRDKTRPPLTPAEIKENLKKYLKQAGKIIDIDKAEIVYNNDWLGKLKAADMMQLMSKVSLQQVTEREDFDKRISAHLPVQMHELTYPILVAYDSVIVEADIEIGGTDQLFNFLMGRALMERFDMKPQDTLTTTLLVGTDGARKMSKSLGNYIALDDEPNDMFGKMMSIPDSIVHSYFVLATDLSEGEIAKFEKQLEPKALKQRLGFEIVKIYHGEKKAAAAQENFEKVFSRHEAPADIPALKLKKKMTVIDVVVAAGIMKSKSEARRLIEQGGFEFDGGVIKKPLEEISVRGGEVVRVGKKHFFKASV